MRFFRIARRLYTTAPFAPFDGEGAYRGGSRWNSPGNRMSFASESLSLAMLEYLVHIELGQAMNDDLVLIVAELADDYIEALPFSALPADWRTAPPPRHGTRQIGDAWLRHATSLALIVPSAVVPIERNVLINPSHQDVVHLRIESVDAFSFDERVRGQ